LPQSFEVQWGLRQSGLFDHLDGAGRAADGTDSTAKTPVRIYFGNILNKGGCFCRAAINTGLAPRAKVQVNPGLKPGKKDFSRLRLTERRFENHTVAGTAVAEKVQLLGV
jgi:hypothetical protein